MARTIYDLPIVDIYSNGLDSRDLTTISGFGALSIKEILFLKLRQHFFILVCGAN